MVIEDEALVGRYIKQVLEKSNYQVLDIYSSSDGVLEGINKNKPDVIIVDIMIRGKIDGIELTKLIQNDFNIPIIYLTAYTDDKTIKRAKTTSPYAYLIKPFNEQELTIAVEFAIYEKMNTIKYKSATKKPSNERKEEIIKASISLIADEDDLQKFTIKNIARKIGVTEGAIYKHFKSKNEIVSLMIDYLIGTFNTFYQDIEYKTDFPIKKKIEKIVFKLVDNYYLKDNFVNILFSNGFDRYDKKLEKCVNDLKSWNKKKIKDVILNSHKETLDINNIEPEYIAEMIISSIKYTLDNHRDNKQEVTNNVNKMLNNIYKILQLSGE